MTKKIAAAIALLCVFAFAPASDVEARGKNEPKKPSRAADGATLFKQNCAYCHGSGGRGDGANAEKLPKRPADLTASKASEAEIAGVVKNGKGSCPSWRASLSDGEIDAVASWTRALQR